ncbi:MAG TPA: sensor histidine kinase KdpD [Gemmatimonadales bacterium]
MGERPDPDALLARVQADSARGSRGRLKLFFGAAPGVGKTFTMLEAAQAKRREAVDVVIGIVETHGRADTARLLDGLEVLSRLAITYRGTTLTEFDLDAALARRPGLLLLDELAHTNAPGSRHEKRWQDVAELLDAGLDVYSTLNVQHVASLNDVVAQITSVTVRETVPDAVLEMADEIELVDVSPEVLLQRLREGKVYIPEQASRALEQFFRRGNLSALRELALRQTASRVDAEMRDYRQAQGIAETWPAADRIAVCVGPDPDSARLVRAAKRLAEGLSAEWTAVYVESAAHDRLAPADQAAAVQNLRLAEQLGAATVTLTGDDIAAEILSWGRANNVTKIIAGKPASSRWPWQRASLLDALIRGSGAIDVYVITGAATSARRPPVPAEPLTPRDYGLAVAVVAIATTLGLLFRDLLSTTDDSMLYLLGVVLVGARARQRPALLASVLSIAAFDFCFVPPYYTFAVSDLSYVLTFGMMLGIAVVMARLTGRIREQALRARAREQRTAAAYALSRDVAQSRDADAILTALARHIREAFSSAVTIIRPGPGNLFPEDDGVARWVFERRQMAGLGTQTLPATPALYLPLLASDMVLGVVRVEPRDARDAQDPVRRQLLETFVGQGALALARARLAERNQETEIEVKTERLRTSLLSSLSHDLRTPLAGIEGAASTMLAGEPPAAERRSLAQTIVRESRRMTRLVANLLDMVRLEAGALHVNKEWQPLEEVVGVALVLLEERLQGHPVATHIPPDLPVVPIDGLLVEQVLINLIENAVKYAPPGTPIDIDASPVPGGVVVGVADRGPGIPKGEELRIFEKFHRATEEDSAGGVGLGLTICQGIVAAHGGKMWTENRDGGGALFRFTLPIEGQPPAMVAEIVASSARG